MWSVYIILFSKDISKHGDFACDEKNRQNKIYVKNKLVLFTLRFSYNCE